MNKYWVVGTSTTKYIKDFIKFRKIGLVIGNRLTLNISEKKHTKIYFNDTLLMNSSKTTILQMLAAWEAMGLIFINNKQIIISCIFDDLKNIIEYSKIFLLNKSNNDKVNKYRYSKLINIVLVGKLLTWSDLKKFNLKQTRGELTHKKIIKEISQYENDISKDETFLKRALEVINGY